jgi:ribonuclease HI
MSSRQEVLEIYTDGACQKNGKADALAGIGVYFGKDDPRNISAVLEKTPHTNNRAELWAIKRAFDIIEIENPHVAKVYTDSIYSIKSLTEWITKWKKNKWINTSKKPVSNKDILEPLEVQYNMLKETITIELIHVRGHTGLEDGNHYADRLATDALKNPDANQTAEGVKRQRVE